MSNTQNEERKLEFNDGKEQLVLTNGENFKSDISEIKSLLSQINSTILKYQEKEVYKVEIQKLNETISSYNVKEGAYKQEIAMLNETISNYNVKEDAYKQEIAMLNETINNYNEKEDAYKQEITKLNTTINNYNAKENAYKQEIAKLTNSNRTIAHMQQKDREYDLQDVKMKKERREKQIQSSNTVNQAKTSFERRNSITNRNDIHSAQIMSNSNPFNSNYENYNYNSHSHSSSDQTNPLNYYYEKNPYLNSQSQHISTAIDPFKNYRR